MKHVVSISLGSSSRNHRVVKEILGQEFLIERLGTDGDLKKTKALYEEMDGKADAIGMGGISLFITAGRKKYYFKEALKLIKNVNKTPVVDGNGLKDILEKKAIRYADQELGLNFASKKVLVVCAVDRFGMAEAFIDTGATTLFGDLIFALNLPFPIKTMRGLRLAATTIAPIITRLPFRLVYPVGASQDNESRFIHNRYYDASDVIAGDFHYIKKYMPQKLVDKIVITNTVTDKDVNKLRELGAKLLITTTPEINNRSFGTNVMEAILVAYLEKNPKEITAEDYNRVLDELNYAPRVVDLKK